MNILLTQLKSDLAAAMKIEIDAIKSNSDTPFEMAGGKDKVIAHKTVPRAILSMIPKLGKKPNETSEKDIQQLLKRYISMEKERAIYQFGYLKESDVDGKTAQEVKKLVGNTIDELGDALTTVEIEVAQSYLPKQPSQEEVVEFIKTIDFSKYKNKMQAMGPIMKEFPGLDGSVAKGILMTMELSI